MPGNEWVKVGVRGLESWSGRSCEEKLMPVLRVETNSRGQLKCDGTRAETRFRLSAKRTSPFKLAGASVQSTTGS